MYQSVTPVLALRLYYAGTALFLVLDYVAGINVRVAFLDPWPGWRAMYYLFCFACLAVIAWRPILTTLVTTIESLITLSALIISMGTRAMGLSVMVLETGGVNFLIAGAAAWLGWFRGMQDLQRSLRR
jgi:hypothetical protein